MRHYRRNADVDMRQLERAAYQGDQQALDALVAHKIRAGHAHLLTLFEVGNASPGVVPPGLVASFVKLIELNPMTEPFQVNAWISDPYPDDGVFETADRRPVAVRFGYQDNDQVDVSSPPYDPMLAVEYANDRVEVWAWESVSVETDHGSNQRLLTWPEEG